MQVIKCKNYDECSKVAAQVFIDAIKANPEIILGLATGSSPIGIYKNLISEYQAGNISFKNVRTYNLDEYVGISRENDQSYYYFMHDNLFNHVDINEENVHVPYAYEGKYEESCKAYTEELKQVSVDIQLLGIGANGHIGFNEPSDVFEKETHCVDLTESTIEANKRFFASEADVPRQAYTMGIGNIMSADKVLLIVSGKGKAEILKKVLYGPVTPEVPASILQFHKNVIVVADEEAASLL